LSQRDWIIWIAGFLEGEGSFGYYGKNGLFLQANQVQRWPIDKLNALVPGYIIRRDMSHRLPNRQPHWQWSIRSSQAAGLMMTIYQFMSPRRKEQIMKALEGWMASPRKPYKKRAVVSHTDEDVDRTIQVLREALDGGQD
jgi:hypothetical protein